jgi:Protein of unknown function (DUF3738)
MRSMVPALVISLFALTVVAAQDHPAVPPGSAQFDVVSIKRSPDAVDGGIRSLDALTLRYSVPRQGAQPGDPAPVDDAPEFFTALQEQLGLKLVPERAILPVFVVDHIERPSEN